MAEIELCAVHHHVVRGVVDYIATFILEAELFLTATVDDVATLLVLLCDALGVRMVVLYKDLREGLLLLVSDFTPFRCL